MRQVAREGGVVNPMIAASSWPAYHAIIVALVSSSFLINYEVNFSKVMSIGNSLAP
jgi:hypothetical protein